MPPIGLPDGASKSPALPSIDGVEYATLVFVRAMDNKPEQIGDGDRQVPAPWEGRQELNKLAAAQAAFKLETAHPEFRNSVHGSLNHAVADHELGEWSGKRYTVISPLPAMIEANGLPTALNTVDTWWALQPGQRLKMPQSVLIAPDETCKLDPAALFKRDGDQVLYATRMNDRRERAVLAAIDTRVLTRKAAENLRWFGGKDRRLDYAETIRTALALPRDQRSLDVSAAIDTELLAASKKLAINDTIKRIFNAPVRDGGKYAWHDSMAVTNQTATLAVTLGTQAQSHTGSIEDQAVDAIGRGRAHEVPYMKGISNATTGLSRFVEADPSYTAWAETHSASREPPAGTYHLGTIDLDKGSFERGNFTPYVAGNQIGLQENHANAAAAVEFYNLPVLALMAGQSLAAQRIVPREIYAAERKTPDWLSTFEDQNYYGLAPRHHTSPTSHQLMQQTQQRIKQFGRDGVIVVDPLLVAKAAVPRDPGVNFIDTPPRDLLAKHIDSEMIRIMHIAERTNVSPATIFAAHPIGANRRSRPPMHIMHAAPANSTAGPTIGAAPATRATPKIIPPQGAGAINEKKKSRFAWVNPRR